MKIAFTADLHFGNTTHSNNIEGGGDTKSAEISRVVIGIINTAKENGCTHFVIAGDVFHTNYPSSYHRTIFNNILTMCNEIFEATYVLMGNHDWSKTSKSALSPLKPLILKNVEIVETLTCYDNGLVFVPHSNPEVFDKVELIKDIERQRDKNKPLILIGHYHATGSLSGSENMMLNGGENMIDGWDKLPVHKTFLGHIHKPQEFKKNAWYIGSPAYMDFGERNDKKRFIIYDTNNNVVESIPIRTRLYIQIEYKDLDSTAVSSDSIIKIKDVPRDVSEKHIRSLFDDSHFVEVKYEKIKREKTELMLDDSKNDNDIFNEYAKEIGLSSEIIKLGKGVINEN